MMAVRKMSQFEKAQGVTKTERYLSRLCDKTFLSMWSYPGIYRDQGKEQGGQGKEICDLLVVFENHILIFSDKDCKFPDSGNLDIDWNRWFRRAVLKSAEQTWGAERWIRSFPDRLFLDRECNRLFPLDLPGAHNAVFHLIVVAHDSSRRCKAELGGSGSLMINSRLIGSDHFVSEHSEGMPFAIGDINPSKTFVHVLDDTSLSIVLSTLDTISDFVSYLIKKEQLIRSGMGVMVAGEEDLLAFYLGKLNENGEHDFVLPQDINAVYIDEGHWEEFYRSPEHQAQLTANKISYSWDALIEKSTYHAFTGTHYFSSSPDLKNSEKIYRFMAREPRTRRRLLAHALMELIEKTPKDHRGTRVMFPSKSGDPFYVFLVLPDTHADSYENYREVRGKLLEAYCMVTKLQCPHALEIVGIATETGTSENRSEDLIYFDARTWTESDRLEAQSLQKDLGLLSQTQMFAAKVSEYPSPNTQYGRGPVQHFDKYDGNLRNKPCPCGSGKKYKFCHGR
jgi:hypothetical protein